MQIQAEQLREELCLITERNLTAAKDFKRLTTAQLNYKKNPESWSILECLGHLNLYGDFYLPAIEQAMKDNWQKPDRIFKSGMIGNYFANLMKPGSRKKMKSPVDKDPSNSELSITTIDRFIKQQELMMSLLKQSRVTNLTKVKVPISLTRLIKLRLGDTFRFVIYHNQRHMAQAQRCIDDSGRAITLQGSYSSLSTTAS